MSSDTLLNKDNQQPLPPPPAQYKGFEQETKFFHYHPMGFIEDLTDATKDLCYDIADSLEEQLRKDKHLTKKSDDEIYEEVEKMLDELHKAFAKSFDTFKDYALQHFFTIAPGLQPATTTTSTHHIPSQDEEEDLDAELDKLRQRKDQLDTALSTAKLTSDLWKRKVEMATAIHQQLTLLTQDFYSHSEKDLATICSTVQNLQKQLAAIDAYKLGPIRLVNNN